MCLTGPVNEKKKKLESEVNEKIDQRRIKLVKSSQTKPQRQEKIEFLKRHFKNIEKLDFVGSARLFIEAKQALVDNGYYAKCKNSLVSINDSSVMNLIWDAQGRKRYKHQASRKQTERRSRA